MLLAIAAVALKFPVSQTSEEITMKFVALLSGGKDSCFNIIKCIENKHELMALANLMPQESDVEEINSFMYQSAAHNTIPRMAECFGVPLYRQEIRGKAVVQSLDYDRDDTDEVEDLFLLLQRVIQMHPDIKGVSCGAIVSNYQRLRVEDVCNRLNLTPLTYLWMRDREKLLDEIIKSGVIAVLVKVAGAGLDPCKHLGKDLASMRPILHRLHERFGLDFCGEGGEYESLVLDCSAFKKRLVLLDTTILLDEEDCSVGNLKILQCSVVDKIPNFVSGILIGPPSETLLSNDNHSLQQRFGDQSLEEDNKLAASIREIMRLTFLQLHESFEKVSTFIEYESKENKLSDDNNYQLRGNDHQQNFFTVSPKKSTRRINRIKNEGNRKNRRFNCLYGKDSLGQTSLRKFSPGILSNIDSKDHASEGPAMYQSNGPKEDEEEKAVSQMKFIMQELKELIEISKDCDLRDICFIHLYLSDISLFQIVNGEYCKWFGRNPPSRSCVAVRPVPSLTVELSLFI